MELKSIFSDIIIVLRERKRNGFVIKRINMDYGSIWGGKCSMCPNEAVVVVECEYDNDDMFRSRMCLHCAQEIYDLYRGTDCS